MDFDLAIIGSGPAGYTAALEAAKHRLKTALVEKDPAMLGGVCLNEGCIPLKGLLYYSIHEKDYFKIKDDVMKRARQIQAGLKSRLEMHKIEIINAEARFVSSTELEAGDRKIRAKYYIVATGSSAKRIFDRPNVFSSEKIFSLDAVPQKALIIGGGVIGCEYASFLKNVGVEVTVVEVMDTILFGEDEEAVRTISREFKKKGIRLLEKSKVKEITNDNTVILKTPDSEINEKFDMIFEATGRKPNTEIIGLGKAGVKLTKNKFVEVNASMQTNVPNIYAAGDCIETPMLAYTAYKEAETAVSHIAEGKAGNIDYAVIPKLVFSMPQLGSIGISEKTAKEKNMDCKIYKYFFKAIGKAAVEGKDSGFIKIMTDKATGVIFGASAVGEEIADMMNELSVIVKNKMTVQQVVDAVHIHPSYSEIITEALNYGG